MEIKKLITVFGSDTLQGSVVVKSLLKDGRYNIRALTNSKKDLKQLNDINLEEFKKTNKLEIIECGVNISNKEIESIIKGSDSIFLLTDWKFDQESNYGKRVIDCALKVGVKNLIFSGFVASKKISNGEIQIKSFDIKYEIEEHAREVSINNPGFITSFIYAPMYMQKFNTVFKISKNNNYNNNYNNNNDYQDTSYSFSMPLEPLSKISLGDINDLGEIFLEVVSNPLKYSGQSLVYVGDELTGDEIASKFSKYFGKKIQYNYIPPEIYKTLDIPSAFEIAQSFSYFNKFGLFYSYDTSIVERILKLTTFDEFLKKNSIQI